MTQDMRKRRRNFFSVPAALFFVCCEEKQRLRLKFRPGLTGEGTADIILTESRCLIKTTGGKNVTDQERFMKEAIRQAKKARALEEVPIGCVIVHEGKIIARGYNRRNTDKNTLSHAELNAIRKASKKLGDWRLEGCTMYVTLEPCQMCSGALVQSRIDEVVIGCMNPKAGCAGSVMNLLQIEGFNHQVKITEGVLEEECSEMLSAFFRELREKKKQAKILKKQEAERLAGQQTQTDGTE